MTGESLETSDELLRGESVNNAEKFLFWDSGFGHDKSLEIRKYSKLPENERPYLFYAGDGVSDLSAAKETDIMFAKTGRGELRAAPLHLLLS